MKVLLDTHAMPWWWTDPDRLPAEVLSVLSAPGTEILASAVSAYELAYKHQLGKLDLPAGLLREFEQVVGHECWKPLPISMAHCLMAGQFPALHRDPLDRLLAAQAMAEEAVLVTVDTAFAAFPEVKTLWA